MAHKLSIEALDRTLKDIRNNNKTMGGVTVLFSGGFRQTLPVVVCGTWMDGIKASLKRSFMWSTIERLSLTINMRVRFGEEQGVEEFSEVLLQVGDGTLENTDGLINIPPSLGTIVESQEQMIDSVFPGFMNCSTWKVPGSVIVPSSRPPMNKQRRSTRR
ncbi:uncharacterized protein LOC106474910 [Limulus polyphemus]|uniref:ATP-dependent DNA helicase n=1 Tax=Limulus polyphemus TaxID=6850 RepID=A0ABM1BYG1_LIMPO|nr:uncharacterized protein LOC106474910 [Limulus polyphemus]